ncbi:MAG TPA: enoyl-CoA hydratase-related protein [Actinomycetota bacterium]
MTYEQIRFDREGSVAWLRLNRPEKLNALTATMSHELSDALDEIKADAGVRCVVITGEGRGFCSGQDLSEFEERYAAGDRPDIQAHLADTYHRLIPQIMETPKPVIAGVNGVAAGAGLSLAMACDLRLASDTARFTQAFVKIGLVPDSGGTFFLPRAVGYAKALELSMTGDLIDAAIAERIGLVSRVLPAASFEADLRAEAERLAAMPTAAIAETRALLLEALTLDLHEALAREAKAQERMARTEDHLEGVSAFVQKRDPKFQGR